MQQSLAVMQEEELKKVPTHREDSEERKAYLALCLRRLQNARTQREQNHREFDGMTYMQDYQANLDAANTFLQPKANADDVRVNTATTEKKIEVIWNELLSMNIQHEIHAFDKDDAELIYLGKDLEHLVTRTNQIEQEDDFWVDFIRELLTQRAVFFKEEYVRKTKRLNKDKKITTYQATKTVLPGRKVYLGDINIPAHRINDQPYIVVADIVGYSEANMLYGHLPRFAFVRQGGSQSESVSEDDLYQWRMHSMDDDRVEILHIFDSPNNEYQIIINGVDMHEPGTPLPWGYDGYNIKMVTNKPSRSNFAYGKSPLSSAKSLQALENEMTRNMIRKFRQSIEPPLISMTNALFTRKMFNAGTVTQGLDKDKIAQLIDNPQLNQGEFAFYNLINQKVQEFIGVSNLQQGLSDNKEKTATESLEQLRQGLKNMGLSVFAMIRARVGATYLRTYTILDKFTEPHGEAVNSETQEIVGKYLQFTVKDVDLGNNRKGKKVIKFMDRDLTPEEEQAIYDTEEMEAKKGNLVRLKAVNAKKLREFPLFFYITANQSEREGSALQKVMFEQELKQAAGLAIASQGQVQLDWQGMADNLERIWGRRNLFQKKAPTQQDPLATEGQGEVQGQAEELLKQLEGGNQSAGIPQPARPQQMMDSVRRQSRPQPAKR